MRYILLSIILFFSFQSQAQIGRYLDREIQIEADNDAFTLDFSVDQYYSQGSYGKYRVVDTSSFKKRILAIGLNHRIFTTRGVTLENVENFDRPYAGQLSVTGFMSFYRPLSYQEYALELGVMGPSSLAEPIQKGWHQTFGMPIPQGWDYQINDSPIINAYFKSSNLLLRVGSIQILGESHVGVGTIFNYARPEIMIRLGKFKDLNESVQYGSNLGHRQDPSQYTKETIFFLAYGPEYVFYNATIQGNMLGKQSIHTEEIVNWVNQFRAGVMFAWSSFDLSVIYYHRSIETVGALNHKYVGVRLSQRF